MDNKVVQTLARAFTGLGYACARMNFRGVGQSEGTHDAGIGETDDIALLYEHMTARYPGLPVALSGFSFGTFVQSRLQRRLAEQGRPAERLVLVGCAAGKWDLADVPAEQAQALIDTLCSIAQACVSIGDVAARGVLAWGFEVAGRRIVAGINRVLEELFGLHVPELRHVGVGVLHRVDQSAVEALAVVQKETDDARAEMATLRQLNEREQLRIQREVETVQERAEREALRLSEQASAYIGEVTRDAEAQAREADKHAVELLEEAETLCNRIAMLKRGRIVALAYTEDQNLLSAKVAL